MELRRSFARALPWVAAGLICAAPTLALAQTGAGTGQTAILTTSCGYLGQIRRWIFGVAYVLGAIGLVIIAVSAFLGRFKFSHLIALGGGLFIIAMADILIRFVTDSTNTGMSCTATGVTP